MKLGQLLSTRSDLLPESYIEEFTKLQDSVLPLPFETIRAAVEKELGRSIEDAFESFDQTPLASASIAQVHTAVLPTGERVVVKVQRPDISGVIHQDISLLGFLAGLLERYVPETRVISPTTFVDEFLRTLSQELDFVIEANNMSLMAKNLAEFEGIVIPRLYKSHSTHKVLTQEKLEGIKVNDIKSMDSAGVDRRKLVAVGARAFMKSVLVDGVFHGDLHGGNLFVLPTGQLGIIDFGIVGRLSQRSRDQMVSMTTALISQDFENLCYQYAELGSASASIDFEGFQREVLNTLSPFLGLSLKEMNMGKILIDSTRIATRYHIQVPGDWMIVFKAILTIEGMGRTLDPEFDLLAMGQEVIQHIVWSRYTPERISKDLFWFGRDLTALAKELPRQLRWMLRKFNANDFALELKLPQLADLREQLDRGSQRQTQAFLCIGLLIAGTMALTAPSESRIGEFPIVSVIFYALSLFLGMRALWR